MITVYGASDDLIEVTGDITEEWNCYGDDEAIVAFSNGTVLGLSLGSDDIWRIRALVNPEPELLTITPVPPGEDNNFSDRAELRADCDWVVYGSGLAENKR